MPWVIAISSIMFIPHALASSGCFGDLAEMKCSARANLALNIDDPKTISDLAADLETIIWQRALSTCYDAGERGETKCQLRKMSMGEAMIEGHKMTRRGFFACIEKGKNDPCPFFYPGIIRQ